MKLIGFRHLGLGGKISRKTKRKKTKSGLPISTFSKLFDDIRINKTSIIISHEKDLEYIKNELKKTDIKYQLNCVGGGGGFVYVFEFDKDISISTSITMNRIMNNAEIYIKDKNKYCSLQYIGYDEDGYYDDSGNLCIAKKEVVEQTFKEDRGDNK